MTKNKYLEVCRTNSFHKIRTTSHRFGLATNVVFSIPEGQTFLKEFIPLAEKIFFAVRSTGIFVLSVTKIVLAANGVSDEAIAVKSVGRLVVIPHGVLSKGHGSAKD